MIGRVDGASHRGRNIGGSRQRLGNSAQWPILETMGAEEGIQENACRKPIVNHKEDMDGRDGIKDLPE